ncbi:ABC transporter substrate-binding protein [Vibrio albus]|nr:ABC transporter substrate-binding protein [Vibrio albus]
MYFTISSTDDSLMNEREPVRIGISLTPLSSPFLIAEHLQLFRENNINLSYVTCLGGVKCTNLLKKGKVDYATASESVVMFNSFTDDDLALVVSFVESANDLKLLTLSSSGVYSVNDLRGKKVGVVKASASEFYFDTMLIVNKLKDMPVTKVYLAPEELVHQLISFQVDAVSIWEPYGYRAHLQAGSDVVNLGIPGIYQLSFNLLSYKSYLQSRNDQTGQIIQVLGRAIDWIHTHPEQAKQIVAEKLNIPLNELEWSWNDYVFRLSLGSSLLSNLQLQARWALERGLVEGELPDWRSVIYRQPFDAANKVE